ncbi:MAG: molybdopterin dinucleotide binding domain-containing protein, partial [Desulfofustis sp.]
IGSLAAACGCFNGGTGRGTLLFTGAFSGDSSRLKMEELSSAETRSINMIQLGQALNSLKPPIRAILVYNSNPFSVAPDGSMVRKGLEREDLFSVVHEQVMTPTARYADLLLPATTFLENRDVHTAYGHFYLGVTEPVISPVGESISNFDLFQQLAQRLGYRDQAFFQPLEERIRSYFESIPERPDGIDFDRYEPGTYLLSQKSHFDGCPFDGKQRVFRFIDANAPGVACHPVLPGGIEFDNPDLKSRFPFRLITPPNDKLLNSTFGERHRGDPGPVLIHPADAAPRGIEEGSPVRLHNLRGSARRRARISRDTQPGLVVAEGIYWPAEDGAGAGGINDVTSQQCSDIGGGAIFHEARVDIGLDADGGAALNRFARRAL